MGNMLKSTCKAAKIKILKNTALQELDLSRFTMYNIDWLLTLQEASSSKFL